MHVPCRCYVNRQGTNNQRAADNMNRTEAYLHAVVEVIDEHQMCVRVMITWFQVCDPHLNVRLMHDHDDGFLLSKAAMINACIMQHLRQGHAHADGVFENVKRDFQVPEFFIESLAGDS